MNPPLHRFAAATTLSIAELTALWNAAYEDYFVPLRSTPESMAHYILQLDVDLDSSRVLFVAGEVAGISLSAVRGQRGYLAGFGIVAALRRQGWAALLLDEQLRTWRKTDLTQVQLEVIEQNPARPFYASRGFEEIRVLEVFEGRIEAATKMPVPGPLRRLDATTLGLAHERLHAAHPATWRREASATLALLSAPDVDAFGWTEGDAVVAFAVVQHGPDRAAMVEAACATTAHGECLLRALSAQLPGRDWRLVNEPAGSPLALACARLSMARVIGQVEMRLTLR